MTQYKGCAIAFRVEGYTGAFKYKGKTMRGGKTWYRRVNFNGSYTEAEAKSTAQNIFDMIVEELKDSPFPVSSFEALDLHPVQGRRVQTKFDSELQWNKEYMEDWE